MRRIVAHARTGVRGRVKVRLVERRRPVVYGYDVMAALRVLSGGLLLAMLVMFASSLSRTLLVSACTYSLRDSVRAADLIAVGTIDEFHVLGASSVAEPGEPGERMPVEIQVSVSNYLKGSGPEKLRVYTPAAEISPDGEVLGLSSGTSCARAISLNSHCVLVLVRSVSGLYEENAPMRCSEGRPGVADFVVSMRQLIEEQATTDPTIVSLGDVGTGPKGAVASSRGCSPP